MFRCRVPRAVDPLIQRLIVLAHLVYFVCIHLYCFFFLNNFLKDYLF